MNQHASNSAKDLLHTRWALWLFWIGPWALIVATANTDNSIHTVVWTFGFGVAGLACLINARRCGRTHCFYTGPLYLLAALTSLLYGLELLPLGSHGWNWIAGITAALSILACCGLEMIFGKYKANSD